MLTFLEFYTVLLKFVNFRLYSKLGIKYPLDINEAIEEDTYFSFKSLVLKSKENEAQNWKEIQDE